MSPLYVGYLLLFGAATLICLAGAYRTRAIPSADVRRPLAALLLTSAGWAGAYVGALLVVDGDLAFGFHIVGLVIGFLTVGAWLWFCSAYTGRDLHRDVTVQHVGFLLLALVVLTKLTNPWHGWHFTATVSNVPFTHLALDYNVVYWGSLGLAYALAAIGYFMLFELFRNVGSRGGAMGPLVGLMALPILFNAVGFASPSLLNVSHEPLGVAAFAIGVLSLYGDQFRAVQFAGSRKEPAFVLDEEDRLQEYNRSGRALLPEDVQPERAIGRPIGDLLPELVDALGAGARVFRVGEGSALRYYQLDSHSPGNGDASAAHFLTLTDVTEQKMREEAIEEESATLRQMSRVTADPEAPFEEKISRLLELGRDYLDLPYGFLTEIVDGTQKIVHATGSHPRLQPGSTCPLSSAYCRKTIRGEGLLAVQDAPAEGWKGDPAYETFELGSYVGSRVVVDGDLYGTFCFAASEPRPRPFEGREKAFVDILTRWTSYEIERRQNRHQLQRQNERLEQFASVVSHDLRNPLNVAVGRLSLARTQVQEAEGSDGAGDEGGLPDHLEATGRALGRMERLIGDMLALTWSEQAFEEEDMDICSIQQVASDAWEQVEADGATLQVEPDVEVWAHEGRLQQLLENLFRNAVEHGGSEVTVTVGAMSDGFYVEDDGGGIPEEKREKVFERGYSSVEDGTGLGLSIVRSVAEAHGWTATATEGRTGGARFEFAGGEPPEG